MKNIKTYEQYYNENDVFIYLTDEEKDFLFRKLEYKKRKKAEKEQNQVFQLLKGTQNYFNHDQFLTILNSLEYTFRKKLSGIEKPIKKEVFFNIQNKIPEDWIGIKYSSITMKNKREEKEKAVKNFFEEYNINKFIPEKDIDNWFEKHQDSYPNINQKEFKRAIMKEINNSDISKDDIIE